MNRSEQETQKSKYKKGTRVVCRVDADEWYIGSINSVDPIQILFDDGTTSEPSNRDMRYVKRMIVDRHSVAALTLFQAEPLWKKHLTRVLYNHAVESEFKIDLKKRPKPWSEFQQGLRFVSTLVPFNELLSLDFRAPALEYSLGMLSVHVDKLTPKIVESLVRSTSETVSRFASACGLIVQHSDDSSRFAISNAHIRQQVGIKLGAFADGRSYVQVIPF